MKRADPALVCAFVEWRPRPCARPRFDSTRRRTFTSRPSERAARELALLLGAHTPAAPFEGPLRLTVHFLMPIPQRPTGAQCEGAAHVCKPDADNLAKMVMDTLSRLRWWGDDAQVSTLVSHKRYSARPGVHVRIDRDEGAW